MSTVASNTKLNRWEGSLKVTVVGLLIRSPNLPQKLQKRNHEKGWDLGEFETVMQTRDETVAIKNLLFTYKYR